jgi:hypothetical protein
LQDKYLYKRKYIDWEPQEKTDALIIGSAVDAILTRGQKALEKEFTIVSRRSTKETDDGDTRIQLNPTMAEKVMGIAESVNRQDIWKDLKKKTWKKQVILTDEDLMVCGMLDFLLVSGDTAIIVDLKTANTIDPKKYYWHSLDYGYPLQLAFYKYLVKKNYGVERVNCYHLTVEKDPDNLYNCALFQFDNDLIDYHIEVMKNGLKELRAEKKFSPKNVGWKNKIIIANMEI